MVPLQAVHIVSNWASNTQHAESYSLTELLLDDLEDLLLVEFLGKTLDRGQGLTAIALCEKRRVSTDLENNFTCCWLEALGTMPAKAIMSASWNAILRASGKP